MIDTAQSLGSAYHVVIEKVYLCSGLDGYVPKFDPSVNEFGCLADSKNLLYRFKVLVCNTCYSMSTLWESPHVVTFSSPPVIIRKMLHFLIQKWMPLFGLLHAHHCPSSRQVQCLFYSERIHTNISNYSINSLFIITAYHKLVENISPSPPP